MYKTIGWNSLLLEQKIPHQVFVTFWEKSSQWRTWVKIQLFTWYKKPHIFGREVVDEK